MVMPLGLPREEMVVTAGPVAAITLTLLLIIPPNAMRGGAMRSRRNFTILMRRATSGFRSEGSPRPSGKTGTQRRQDYLFTIETFHGVLQHICLKSRQNSRLFARFPQLEGRMGFRIPC